MNTLFRTRPRARHGRRGFGRSARPRAATDEGIAVDATSVPAALERRAAETVRVEIETVEKISELNDGSMFRYWTFDCPAR